MLICSKAYAGVIENKNWWFPYIGSFNGEWELSTGVHFWNDHFKLRNLQLRSSMDIAPGLRTNMVLRSNRKFDSLEGFNSTFDELFLEGYGFNYGEHGIFSTSLKVGKMRYLRFPYPDLISTFDQVPGTEDLRIPGAETGYKGAMITLDYASRSGLGYHLTGINRDFGSLPGTDGRPGADAGADNNTRSGTADRTGLNVIENYLYYRSRIGIFDLEARVGEMQLRHPSGGVARGEHPYQLGQSGTGYNIYLGANWKGYKAGILYEDLYDRKYKVHDVRTGLMVTFAFSKVTELLGSVRADYTRSPEGFVAHLPLLKGKIGNLKDEPPEDGKLVGEIEAERVVTYWQNGQGRNFYEHRISHWGITPDRLPDVFTDVTEEAAVAVKGSAKTPEGTFEAAGGTDKRIDVKAIKQSSGGDTGEDIFIKDGNYSERSQAAGDSGGNLVVVIKKEPWYLRLEALVSPQTEFKDWEDLVEWERHRQGPAQLCQRVTYQFYRVKK